MTLSELLADPCSFFREATKKEPHDYQRWLLRQPLTGGARLVLLLSRRAGKSLTVAVRLLYEALTTTERRFRILLLAPSAEQAGLIYSAIRDALYHPVLSALCKAYQQRTGRKLTFSNQRLQVPNKGHGLSTISLLGADLGGVGKYHVGFGADVLAIDESSLISDGTYFKIRESRRTGAYRSEILVGTPRQESGFFFQACQPTSLPFPSNCEYTSAADYQVCHRDVEHVPHIRDVSAVWAEVQRDMTASDQTDVEQEHYARFTSGYGRFFTLQDVEACLGDIKDWSEYVRGSRIILSIDLAIEKDESVALWFAASSRSHLTLIKAASFKRNPENPETIAIESMQEICEHVKTLRQRGLIPHYAYADASKDGSFPDLLQQIAGVKCEPVIWSAPTKVDLMFSLRDALRAQQFTLPKPETGYHARRLIEQLLRYEYEVSAFGNYLFNRKESGHGKRWDDDYVSALAMSTRYLNSQVRAAPLARVGGAGRRNSNKWDLLVSSKRDLREEQALLSV